MIKKFYIDEANSIVSEPNVSCIGYFDGVHIGHQALIKKTVELSKQLNVEPYLITFYPDPADIINKNSVKHINNFNKRLKLFEQFGIKGVIIINFNKDVMSIKPQEFINNYLSKLSIKALVCGFDFHYGYKGEGNYQSLVKDGKKYFKTYMVDEVKYYGKKVSSTRIRKELENKNYKLVNKLLGYEYK